ncbi:MAG: sugar phosphate isomerase/epimerase, partial [Planctomycetes bacterium]|nr:sugar phosphate isomerase/epimerase [Planctomycetota bacterium]
NGQEFSLETGQEKADVLLEFIHEVNRPNVKVNFDPANMILYGTGEPIPALKVLGKYVVGVHCKDGTWPTEKDKLGHETVLGQGKVNIPLFIKTLKEVGYAGPLTIEREITGDQHAKDIVAAREYIEKLKKEAGITA